MRLALMLLCGFVLWDAAKPTSAFADAALQIIVSSDELALSSQSEYPNFGKRIREPLADPGSSNDGEASVYAIRPNSLNQSRSARAFPRAPFEGLLRRAIATLPHAPRAPPQPSVPA